ncbi:MAG: hypothetical protein LC808_17370, partial [Actinobacteria bacterium]|nr:hypothetical protein [Actinomycetota bacterium]
MGTDERGESRRRGEVGMHTSSSARSAPSRAGLRPWKLDFPGERKRREIGFSSRVGGEREVDLDAAGAEIDQGDEGVGA